jgi:predicted metal-binding protein
MRDSLEHLLELDSNMFWISFKAGAALFPGDCAGC